MLGIGKHYKNEIVNPLQDHRIEKLMELSRLMMLNTICQAICSKVTISTCRRRISFQPKTIFPTKKTSFKIVILLYNGESPYEIHAIVPKIYTFTAKIRHVTYTDMNQLSYFNDEVEVPFDQLLHKSRYFVEHIPDKMLSR